MPITIVLKCDDCGAEVETFKDENAAECVNETVLSLFCGQLPTHRGKLWCDGCLKEEMERLEERETRECRQDEAYQNYCFYRDRF